MNIGVSTMMYHIEKGLLLSLLEKRGCSLNSFTKVCNCDISTVRKFNDGKGIRKVHADKIWNALKTMPLGDKTNDFKTLKY